MQITLRVPASAPANQTADFLREVELSGFSGVGVTDSQLLMRDVYVTLGLAAQKTSKLTLCTAVTNPVTRHISVLASAIQTVEELAPGRVKIILGSGYSSVNTIGQRPATLNKMRDCVITLKKLLAGEPVSLNGFEARLPYASARDIPILIAATGPKTIELAGEVADGVLLLVGIHPNMIDTARKWFYAGAKKSARNPKLLDMMVSARVRVEKDLKTSIDYARPICAQWVVEPFHAQWLRDAGLDIPDVKLSPELAALYPDIPHAEDWEAAKKATAFLTDEKVQEIGDSLGIFGTPERCVDKIRQLSTLGVDNWYAMTIESYELPRSTLTAFKDHIFPMLNS